MRGRAAARTKRDERAVAGARGRGRRRALALTSRLPWSRCAARIAFIASKKSSLCTKPRWSAARAKVSSLRWVRPIPPPTTMLNPLSVSPSGSMMTTQPMSLMYRSTELSPGTVNAILNFLGR